MQDYYTYLSLGVALLGTLVAVFGEAFANEKNKKAVAIISGLVSVIGFAFSFFLTQQSNQESNYTKNQLEATRKNTDILKNRLDSSRIQIENIQKTSSYLTRQLDEASSALIRSGNSNAIQIGERLSKTSDSLQNISKQTDKIIDDIRASMHTVEKTEIQIGNFEHELNALSEAMELKLEDLYDQSEQIKLLISENDSLQNILIKDKLDNVNKEIMSGLQEEVQKIRQEIRILRPGRDSINTLSEEVDKLRKGIKAFSIQTFKKDSL